jgi:hypothetical protein
VQILQTVPDEEPIDLIDDKNIETFMKSLLEWMQEMQRHGAAMKAYGYALIPKGLPFQSHLSASTLVEIQTRS